MYVDEAHSMENQEMLFESEKDYMMEGEQLNCASTFATSFYDHCIKNKGHNICRTIKNAHKQSKVGCIDYNMFFLKRPEEKECRN